MVHSAVRLNDVLLRPIIGRLVFLHQLKAQSLKGFAIDGFPLAICSAGALLVYLEQTHHSGLRNICSISRIDRNSYVWMDKFTLRNLEEVEHCVEGVCGAEQSRCLGGRRELVLG